MTIVIHAMRISLKMLCQNEYSLQVFIRYWFSVGSSVRI